MGKLDGKVAVITGAASGIGEASARLFFKEGAKVVVADIQDEKGKQLVEELGSDVAFIHTDVAKQNEIKIAVDLAVEKFGRLDCMFNNAGIGGMDCRIGETTEEGFDHTMAVLFKGVFFGIKHASNVMLKQGSGSIINTTSGAGILAGRSGHIYAGAKAGVQHLTKSISLELGENNIRVNCIAPGAIMTPILFTSNPNLDFESKEKADYSEKLKQEKLKQIYSQLQPMKKVGLPEDIAKGALWLASDESEWVTGHTLVIDGGMTAGNIWYSDKIKWMSKLQEAILE
jgi:NAD(P)-dependent dehydrogenase (short-subunit alcohol dehydrogenase family)